MPMQYQDDSVWDEFIQSKQLDEEEENEFLEFLFEEDIDPDQSSLKTLDDAYTQFADEESA